VPDEWRNLVPVGPPRIDAVTVMLPGDPEAHGFVLTSRNGWARGEHWRGYPQTDATGYPWTRAVASAEICAAFNPAHREWAWCGDARVTRVDVKRDCIGAPVWMELVQWLAGARGQRGADEKPRKGNIVRAGSRESSVCLRIYMKSVQKDSLPRYLLEEWRRNGWKGEAVTRVEFEFKKEAVEGLTVDTLEGAVGPLWADGLARLRLCARRPELYSQRNKAPTCEGWKRLGVMEKQERKRKSKEPADWAERCVAAMLRRMAKSGVDVAAAVRLANGATVVREERATRAKLARAKDDLWRLDTSAPDCQEGAGGEDDAPGVDFAAHDEPGTDPEQE